MNKIFITGASGFVGKHILNYFNSKFTFNIYNKNDQNLKIDDDIVIHLAGKAHDLKNISQFEEYYTVNTELTKKIFDNFLISSAKVFIMLSSVKAVADHIDVVLTENQVPNPKTHYGKSKLLAEQYILNKEIPEYKRVYILRPCMIYGTGNKGNLNLLYSFATRSIPWPLGSFINQRSFCSIDNLCFVVSQLLENTAIPSGIYNVADDDSISTNEIIKIIAECNNKKVYILKIPKSIIKFIAQIGDIIKLPLNTERLSKLTETYLVSNQKLKKLLNQPLPTNIEQGLRNTITSLNKH
jgi:nucleoside-diphosphate-sugar epimerase